MHCLDGFGLLLIDDHPLFREGLMLALRTHAPGLHVGGVASVSEALAVLDQPGGAEQYDLVLLDWRLPGENGLVGAARLRAAHPALACALMSGADEPGLGARARAAGLVGFFSKSLEVEQLLSGLGELARGGHWFADQLPAESASSGGLLTERQRQIVRLAAGGASNKEIAQALGITPHTVKNHLAQIFDKLGASNRAQAVLLAYERDADAP